MIEQSSRKDILRSTVNFYISAAFIASFGIFMLTMVLKISRLTNPLIDPILPGIDADAQDTTL